MWLTCSHTTSTHKNPYPNYLSPVWTQLISKKINIVPHSRSLWWRVCYACGLERWTASIWINCTSYVENDVVAYGNELDVKRIHRPNKADVDVQWKLIEYILVGTSAYACKTIDFGCEALCIFCNMHVDYGKGNGSDPRSHRFAALRRFSDLSWTGKRYKQNTHFIIYANAM